LPEEMKLPNNNAHLDIGCFFSSLITQKHIIWNA